MPPLSGGSVFVSLGAHVAREGFDRYGRLVAGAKDQKFHNIRLGGDVVKDGFERYARAVNSAQAQTRDFAVASDSYYGRVNAAVRSSGEAAVKYLGLTREQLGYTAREYATVAAAAQHSADAQRGAFASVAKDGEKAAASQVGAAKKTEESWKKGFNNLANMGKWTTIGGAALAAVSVKAAATFQKHMELIYTQAGYTKKQVDSLSKSVEDLAPKVGIGPEKLAEGLYHVASAGIAYKDSLGVLAVAAKGARSGNDDLVSVTNALTAAMNAFHLPAKDAAAVMGQLDRIAGHGNMTMRDLTAAMTTGLPGAARAVGLTIHDLGAALDTLTQQGVPAQQGATRLRTVLSLIADPTAKAQKALAQLGISQDTLAKDFRSKGLVGALDDLQGRLHNVFGRKLNTDEIKKAMSDYEQTLIGMGVKGKALDTQMSEFHARLMKQGEGAIKSSQLIADAFGGARMGTTMQILMQNTDNVRKHFELLNVSSAKDTALFNAHWHDTQKTFSQEAAQVWAGIQKIAIQLGDYLIPKLEAAAKALDKFGKFLGQHKELAHALAEMIGVVLVAAVVAFFTRLGIGIASNIKSLYNLGKAASGAVESFIAGTPAVTLAQEKQRVAVTKTTEAVVAQGEAAAATSAELGRLAKTGEAVSAGGVIIPRGTSRGGVQATEAAIAARGGGSEAAVAGATRVEEGVVSAGLVSSVRSRLGTLFGRATKGLGIGLGISLVSDIAGGMVGGKAGHAISSIGKDTALGASFGSLFGPEGTVGGAIIGGLIGTIKNFIHVGAPHYGKDMATALGKPLEHLPVGVDVKAYKDRLDQLNKIAADNIQKAHDETTPHTDPRGQNVPGSRYGAPLPGPTPAQVRDAERRFRAVGIAYAKALTDGISQFKYFSENDVLKEFVQRFDKAAPQVRDAGAKAVIQWAHGMEDQHRLPAGATDSLIKDLEGRYSGLRDYLKKSAHDTNKDVADELSNKRVVNSVQGQIDDISKLWFDAPKLAKTTATNVYKNWKTEMDALRHEIKTTHDPQMRAELKDAYNKLQDDSRHAAAVVANHWLNSTAGMAKGSAKNLQSLLTAFVLAYGEIDSQTAQAAKLYGAKGVRYALKHPADVKAGTVVSSLDFISREQSMRAGGGIANPGAASASDDHLLVNPAGRVVAAMSGTEGIVNTPQMERINYWGSIAKGLGMDQYGSLDDLWSSGMTHHAKGGRLDKKVKKLATGGVPTYVFPMKKNVNWGRVDEGVDFSMNPGDPIAAIGNSTIKGIVPWFRGQPYMLYQLDDGPRKGSYVYVAEQIKPLKRSGKVKAGEIIARYASSGTAIEMGWGTSTPGNALAHDHYTVDGMVTREGLDFQRFLKGLAHGKLVGGLGGSGTTNISEPKIVGPGGFLENIAQAAIHTTTHDANAYLGRLAAKSANSVFGSAGSSSGLNVSAVGNITGRQKWARAMLKALNIVATPTAVNDLVRWAIAEGGNWNNSARYNPLNTTMPAPGAGNTGSQGNIKVYRSWAQGIAATVATLRHYPTILAALRHGNYASFRNAVYSSPWGTKTGLTRGGLIPKFAQGGPLGRALRVGGRVVRAATGKPLPGASHAPPTRAKTSTHRPHVKHRHSLGLSARALRDLPSVSDFNRSDAAVQAIDQTYSQDERYLELADGQLTPADLNTLIGLRSQEGALEEEEQQTGTKDLSQLGTFETRLHGQERGIRGQATKTARQINQTKQAIKNETRRLARERHKRAGKMMQIADKLAGQVATAANQRSALADKEDSIRSSYRSRIRRAQSESVPDDAGAIAAIRNRYKGPIAAAITTAHKNALIKRRDAEIAAVKLKHRGAVAAHQAKVRGLETSRDAALSPILKQRRHLTDHTRHLRQNEASQRRKYQHKGWAVAWQIETAKWKLQDKLAKLEAKEKKLSGSTTGVGKGGELGTILHQEDLVHTAQQALQDRIGQIPGQLIDNALDQYDIAGQEAQAQADTTHQDVDVSQYIPPAALQILQRAGIATDQLHRIYHPADDGSSAATDTTNTTGTSISEQVLAELNTMGSASQQLFSQFGSNSVAAKALPAALAGAGTVTGAGVRYFGAAGGALNTDLGLSPTGGTAFSPQPTPVNNNFFQTNHYATGPEDPHIHAQASALEFQTAFG